MGINFENSDNRKTYLSEKLDDLLDGINNHYGTVLMDELISRLERTVSEFNDEVKDLMEQLRTSSEKKEQLLEKIKSSELVEAESGEAIKVEKEPEKELSEWEKKLEAVEKS